MARNFDGRVDEVGLERAPLYDSALAKTRTMPGPKKKAARSTPSGDARREKQGHTYPAPEKLHDLART